jgi:hypothetical protein
MKLPNRKTKKLPTDTNKHYFDWTVDKKYYAHGDLMFFCEYTLPVLQNLVRNQMEWGRLIKLPHCHSFRINDASCKFHKLLYDICSSRDVSHDSFYQMPGKASSQHRIIGYRKNRIFHLFYDDKEHSFFPKNRDFF